MAEKIDVNIFNFKIPDKFFNPRRELLSSRRELKNCLLDWWFLMMGKERKGSVNRSFSGIGKEIDEE